MEPSAACLCRFALECVLFAGIHVPPQQQRVLLGGLFVCTSQIEILCPTSLPVFQASRFKYEIIN